MVFPDGGDQHNHASGRACTLLHAQDADAPTNKLTAEQINAQWVKAVSKYDGPRQQILSHVAAVNAAGPYTPDWDTLATMTVPEWYRDAKFGIFINCSTARLNVTRMAATAVIC